MKLMYVLGAVAAVAIGGFVLMARPGPQAQAGETVIPELGELARQGEEAYNGTCAACHGVNLSGTDQGPSFLSRVYVKGHHGDMAFLMAVRQGARQHHWPFGDMPPQPDVSDEDVAAIVAYVRTIQAANGF